LSWLLWAPAGFVAGSAAALVGAAGTVSAGTICAGSNGVLSGCAEMGSSAHVGVVTDKASRVSTLKNIFFNMIVFPGMKNRMAVLEIDRGASREIFLNVLKKQRRQGRRCFYY